jgi:hypothetical protein
MSRAEYSLRLVIDTSLSDFIIQWLCTGSGNELIGVCVRLHPDIINQNSETGELVRFGIAELTYLALNRVNRTN